MDELCIDRNEVLRYLGYKHQALDDNTEALVEECIEEIKAIVKERYVYKFFEVEKDNEKLLLKDCTLELQGNDIRRHLENSLSCVLMAVTLGNAVDSRIRYYEKFNMARALILDACATTAVEEVCDRVCEKIKEKVKMQNKTLTSRFSPGYGDLPLSIQKDFIKVLEADKIIGLTASESSILIPRKSVTAVVGVSDKNVKTNNNACLSCKKYKDCEFRRRNASCGA